MAEPRHGVVGDHDAFARAIERRLSSADRERRPSDAFPGTRAVGKKERQRRPAASSPQIMGEMEEKMEKMVPFFDRIPSFLSLSLSPHHVSPGVADTSKYMESVMV